MNNAEANRPIANRFFEAFDALVAMGKIKSVRSYCDPNGVDRRNMELLRKDPTRNLLQPFWLVPLITEYGVSAKWLLTGNGFCDDLHKKHFCLSKLPKQNLNGGIYII